MRKTSIDAGGSAYAASAMNHVTTTDLEVFERAITLRIPKAPVCPQPGWTTVLPWSPTTQGSSVHAGVGSAATGMQAVIDMQKVRTFKSRSEFHAISSSG